MRLSQTCKDIEEQRVLLRKQCEEAEYLLNSNDTRRFIEAENSNIVKALQSVLYSIRNNLESFLVNYLNFLQWVS
jgi:hypothetical protein